MEPAKLMPFSELIAGEKPVLVDFSAEWCGPSKMMKPILHELKSLMGDKVTILKVDVDKSPDIARPYNIQSVPTLILFKNDKILWRGSGVLPANNLQQIIQQHQQ
jgi:thioredoxin 1